MRYDYHVSLISPTTLHHDREAHDSTHREYDDAISRARAIRTTLPLGARVFISHAGLRMELADA